MTELDKFKVSKVIKEIFGTDKIAFTEHPSLISLYVKTKNVMCKFSTYKKLELSFKILGYEIFEITGSPMPSMNNYISYQIDFYEV